MGGRIENKTGKMPNFPGFTFFQIVPGTTEPKTKKHQFFNTFQTVPGILHLSLSLFFGVFLKVFFFSRSVIKVRDQSLT